MPGGQEPIDARTVNGEINITADYLTVAQDLEVYGNTILHGNLRVDGITNNGIKRTFIEGPGIDISTNQGPGKTIRLMTNNGSVRVTVDDTYVTTTVPIILPSDPITNLQAATKQYVDSTVSGFGSITSLTGDVTTTGSGAASSTIQKIQGETITLTSTVNNDTLSFNGTSWINQSTNGNGNIVRTNSASLITPDLGTPTNIVLTNATGNASSLTSGNVTTNANLTGVITSSGNTTSWVTPTGSGSVVLNNTPTLITPNIGSASGTSLSVTNQLTSTIVTGTPPLVVSSTTLVPNLYVSKSVLADTVTPSGVTLSGDVTGTAAASSVVKIQGNSVLNNTPLNNQVFVYNGSAWVPQDIPATAGQAKIIYSTGVSSGISTYNNETFTKPTGVQVDTSVSLSSSTSPLLIKAFITSPLGVTSIPAGLWILNTYAQASSASGCAIRTEFYSRTSGGTETFLFSNDGTTLNNNGTPELFAEDTPQSAFSIGLTDVLVVKYFATNTGGTKTVTLSYDGTNHVTNIITPFIGYFTTLNVTGNASILGNTSSNQFVSTIATGTAPFIISSTTRVSNLNVDACGNSDTTSISSLTYPSSSFNLKGVIYADSITHITSTATAGNPGYVLTANSLLNPVWAAPATSGTVTSVGLTMPSQFTVSGSPITSSGTLGVTLTSSTGSGNIVLSTNPTFNASTGTQPFTINSTTLVPNLYVARSVLADNVTTNALPTFRKITNIAYKFTSSSTITVSKNATYTNNGATFTVYRDSVSTTIVFQGSGAPTASGTLTYASGTGPSTIVYTSYVIWGYDMDVNSEDITYGDIQTIGSVYAFFNLPPATTLQVGKVFHFVSRSILSVRGNLGVYYHTDTSYVIPIFSFNCTNDEWYTATLVDNTTLDGTWVFSYEIGVSKGEIAYKSVTDSLSSAIGLLETFQSVQEAYNAVNDSTVAGLTTGEATLTTAVGNINTILNVSALTTNHIVVYNGTKFVSAGDCLISGNLSISDAGVGIPVLSVNNTSTGTTSVLSALSPNNTGFFSTSYFGADTTNGNSLQIKYLYNSNNGDSNVTILASRDTAIAWNQNRLTFAAITTSTQFGYVFTNDQSATTVNMTAELCQYATNLVKIIGHDTGTGNSATIEHHYAGNNDPANYLKLFTDSGSSITLYNTVLPHIGFTGDLEIDVSNSSQVPLILNNTTTGGNYLYEFLSPNLTSGNGAGGWLGQSATSQNGLLTNFVFTGNNSASNYVQFSVGSSSLSIVNNNTIVSSSQFIVTDTTNPSTPSASASIKTSGGIVSSGNIFGTNITGTSSINTSNTSNPPTIPIFSLLATNLSGGNSCVGWFGQDATIGNGLKFEYFHTASNSLSNYASISLNHSSLPTNKQAFISFYADGHVLLDPDYVIIDAATDATTTSDGGLRVTGGISAVNTVFIGGVYKSILSSRTGYTDVFRGGTAESSNDSFAASFNFVSTGSTSNYAKLGVYAQQCLQLFPMNITASSTTAASVVITGGLGISDNLRVANGVTATTLTLTGSQLNLSSGNYFIDQNSGTGGQLIIGYNTVKNTTQESRLQIYNNVTNRLLLFSIESSGTISGGNQISAYIPITSSVITGTAPFIISSTTRVSNLNVAACGLADNVTTNANLTGVITSVGNATSIASQTGTGTKFVVDTGPTISAPTLTGNTNFSGLTASTALALDGSKNVVSVTNTGTGNNVLATSPTISAPTISGTMNLTGTFSNFSTGNFFIDQTGTGSQLIIGYNTTKNSVQEARLQIYNNSTDRTLLLEARSRGTGSGNDYVYLINSPPTRTTLHYFDNLLTFTLTTGLTTNCDAGVVYQDATTFNNFTVQTTANSGATSIVFTGTYFPASSGTFNKVSGTGTGQASMFWNAVANTTSTYTVPTNVKYLVFTLVGGGGGGSGNGNSGCGGGGGCVITHQINSPATTYLFEVGFPGAGGAFGNTTGSSGTNSKLKTSGGTVLVNAGGGGGGGGSATCGAGGLNVVDGNRSNMVGCAGGIAVGTFSGFGGASSVGGGAAAVQGIPGIAATGYGGGGGGGGSIAPAGGGGSGCTGIIWVDEYYT